jgi:hypothetical protein
MDSERQRQSAGITRYLRPKSCKVRNREARGPLLNSPKVPSLSELGDLCE